MTTNLHVVIKDTAFAGAVKNFLEINNLTAEALYLPRDGVVIIISHQKNDKIVSILALTDQWQEAIVGIFWYLPDYKNVIATIVYNPEIPSNLGGAGNPAEKFIFRYLESKKNEVWRSQK